MIREVDLVSYLPPFMSEFKEIAVTFEAENPEFMLVWKAADQVLQNEFIETADEYGISRFEKVLNILPSTEDTLESRRARVQTRWLNTIPYTLKAFIAKLVALCGNSNFTIKKDYSSYKVELFTSLELFGQVEELERIIETMIPSNIVVLSENMIPFNTKGMTIFGGGICTADFFIITNDSNENITASSTAYHGAGVVNTVTVTISDAKTETLKTWDSMLNLTWEEISLNTWKEVIYGD